MASDAAGRDAQRDDGGEALRVQQSAMPGYRRAPVVADDDGLLDAEGVQNADRIGGQVAHGVASTALRRIRAAVSAHVGRDGVEAGGGQRGKLLSPGIPELGEAVQEQDERSAPCSAMWMLMPLAAISPMSDVGHDLRRSGRERLRPPAALQHGHR